MADDAEMAAVEDNSQMRQVMKKPIFSQSRSSAVHHNPQRNVSVDHLSQIVMNKQIQPAATDKAARQTMDAKNISAKFLSSALQHNWSEQVEVSAEK